MRNLFFFSLGVGATAFVVVKGRQLARKATPAHVQESLSRRAGELLQQAGEFLTTVQESMDQRERELRTELGITDHR